MSLGIVVLIALVACKPTPDSERATDDCRVRIQLVDVIDDAVVLAIENTGDATVTIAGSSQASFVTSDGDVLTRPLRAGGDDWFLSFQLPARSRKTTSIHLAGGDVAKLDRIEVASSRPGRVPLCTIREHGLATRAGELAAGTSDSERDAVAMYQQLTEAVCACTTMACVEDAHTRMAKQHVRRQPKRMKQRTSDAINELGRKQLECTSKLAP